MWITILFVAYYFYVDQALPKPERISYSAFKEAVADGEVESVTFKLDQIRGQYLNGDTAERGFVTTIPGMPDNSLLPLLEQKKVTVIAETVSNPPWLDLLIGIVPWLFLAAFFVYSSRMLQQRMGKGAGGGLFDFNRSRARLFEPDQQNVSFDDVAGLDSVKQDLKEIIEFLKFPERFQSLGAKIPRGVLLMGSPGTGKTLLARATASEAGVAFFSVSASEFIEMYVGIGASRVRDMFAEARKKAPSLIFIDEIDSIGRIRGTGVGGGHDEREQTLNQILAEMDGFRGDEPLIVLAATNRPDVLDPALLRPGRFDRKVVLELPQKNARMEILKVHMRSVPTESDVDVEELGGLTTGFSGADFLEAHDKVVMGSERPDLLLPSERRRTAVHESGHALTAMMLPESDPIHQVSIIPRGRSLGVTEQLPLEDRHNYSQPYVEARLAVMLGGRVSEKLILGSISSGAADDLEQATRLARLMITQWGMSAEIGPVHFRDGGEHPYLGYELTQQRDYSEQTASKIDAEVKRIVEQAEQTTLSILEANQGLLGRLVDELIKSETLGRTAIERIMQIDESDQSNQSKVDAS